MKRITKLLSLLLALMLALNSMVFDIVSEDALPAESETASDMELDIAGQYDVGDEIVEWREEGVKHYYLGDGQYQAVVRQGEYVDDVGGSRASTYSSITAGSNRLPLDTYISSANKAVCYGDSEEVWVGTTYIGLFYYNKINLPKNINIESATLNFAYYYHTS